MQNINWKTLKSLAPLSCWSGIYLYTNPWFR